MREDPTMSRIAFALALALAAASLSPLSAQQRNVVVNRVRLTETQLTGFERQWNVRVPDGNYWYDKSSGAWGMMGGPTAGWMAAGLNLGGPLPQDASNGNTGVIINGRELPMQDVAALMQITPVYRGRWWVDSQGTFGAEGGPPIGNLRLLAQQRQQAGAVYANGGRDMLGTDSNGCHYFNSIGTGGSESISWASPGC